MKGSKKYVELVKLIGGKLASENKNLMEIIDKRLLAIPKYKIIDIPKWIEQNIDFSENSRDKYTKQRINSLTADVYDIDKVKLIRKDCDEFNFPKPRITESLFDEEVIDDEALARRLQAEWGDGGDVVPNNNLNDDEEDFERQMHLAEMESLRDEEERQRRHRD